MLELILFLLLAIAMVVFFVAWFLWRNGALKINRDDAQKNIDALIEEARHDVKNWRDHLGKK